MHLGCTFPSRIIGLAGAAGLLQTSPVLPCIKYADSGDLQIAYQVVGNGPVDVVVAVDWAGNIELAWENPRPNDSCAGSPATGG